jgi:hypothetical protein
MALWSYVSPDGLEGRRFEVELDGRELSPEARAALA